MTRSRDLKALAFEHAAGKLGEVERIEIDALLAADAELQQHFTRAAEAMDAVHERAALGWSPDRADRVLAAVLASTRSKSSPVHGEEGTAKPTVVRLDQARQALKIGLPESLRGAVQSGEAEGASDALLRGKPEGEGDAHQRGEPKGENDALQHRESEGEDDALPRVASERPGTLLRGESESDDDVLLQGASERPDALPRAGSKVPPVAAAPDAGIPARRGRRVHAETRIPRKARPSLDPRWIAAAAIVVAVSAVAVWVGTRPDADPAPTIAHSVPFQGGLWSSPSAQFEVQTDAGYTLEVDAGRVLVEYIPTPGNSLAVTTPHGAARITGTVFWVDVGPTHTEFGVLEGSVEVRAALGPVRIASGEAYRTLSRRVVKVPAESRAKWEGVVDLEAHRRQLDAEALKNVTPKPEDTPHSGAATPPARTNPAAATTGKTQDPPPPTSAGGESEDLDKERAEPEATAPGTAVQHTDTPTDVDHVDIDNKPPSAPPNAASKDSTKIADNFDKAMTRKDYIAAAQLVEARVKSAPNARGPRLDAARLYLRFLNRPRQAEKHMRVVLKQGRRDGVHDAVRRQYCALSVPKDESLCP